MINGLDLFSGIGGLTIALSPWVQPVTYCENDRHAQSVLLCRMADGSIPIAPIWDDVRTLTNRHLPPIDLVYGGFPCQDVSLAGARKGLEGDRTGLFREAIRLIRECKPKFVFLENVPGIRKFVPSVRGELEALGYDCRDGFLSASEVGAPHIRNRWWLLANSNSKSVRSESQQEQPKQTWEPFDSIWWKAEPDVGRVVNGVPARVDRLRGLGNAVVPQQARRAFEILSGLSEFSTRGER